MYGTNIIDASHLKVTGGWDTGARASSPALQNVNKYPQQHAAPASTSFTAGKTQDDPFTIIAQQLRRLFTEQGDDSHFEKLESLIVHQAFAYVRSNQVHGAALLGISRNVMRTLLKRHGLLNDNGLKMAGEAQDENSESELEVG